jgi:4-amino-4-deoxy-L-arabinose transferase-like glycosyltransferase
VKFDKGSPTVYLTIFLVSLVLKLFLGWLLPLVPDEAYYWVWSHHRQWSYFDHPPMVAWLMSLGQFFETYGSAVRWPSIAMGHATFFIWFFIARDFLSDRHLFWFTMIFLANPFLGPGSLLVTPDIPLLFFWSLGVLLLLRIHSTPQLGYFLLYGAVAGLGFCSKYHMALQGSIALLSIFLNKKLRRGYWVHVAMAVLTAAVFALPVLLWNYNHDWPSFKFQVGQRLQGRAWNPEWTWTFLAGQVAVFLPYVLWSAYRRIPKTSGLLLLWLMTLPLPLFFLLSFKTRIEGNWTIAAVPAVLLLAVYNTHRMRWLAGTAVLHLAIFIGLLVQIYRPWLPGLAANRIKTGDFFRFRDVIERIGEYDPVFASSYQMASKIYFDTKRPTFKLAGLNRIDFFDFRPESIPRESPYFVVVPTATSLPSWAESAGHRVASRRQLTVDYDLIEVLRP